MGSPFDDVFIELLDVNDECHIIDGNPNPQFALIDRKKHRAIIEEITRDETFLTGAIGDSGGYRLKCRVAEFASEPKQGAPVQKLGKGPILHVLSVIERNGVEYEITVGDMAAQDNER